MIAAGDNFPETTVDAERRTVQVRLTASTNKYPVQAMYQSAHECIHCLGPAGRRDTIYFEEGLANHFALTYPELPSHIRSQNEVLLLSLFAAPLAAFRKLNATDEHIRHLRLEQPYFDLLTPQLVHKYFSASLELARVLCRRLPEERPPTL